MFLELASCIIHGSVFSYELSELIYFCFYNLKVSEFGTTAESFYSVDFLGSEDRDSFFCFSELTSLANDLFHYSNEVAGLEGTMKPPSLIAEISGRYFLRSALVTDPV